MHSPDFDCKPSCGILLRWPIKEVFLSISDHRFLDGNSELSKLFRKKDWSDNPLGSPGSWAPELKTLVSLMLNSSSPMFIIWGRDRIFLYNDSYIEILAEKHPAALGERFEVLWSEVWQDVLPLIEKADRGEPVFLENMKFCINRNNKFEDAYFTFSYCPIRNSDADVVGLFCTLIETTKNKTAELALKQGEQRLKLALKSGGLGSWQVDIKTHILTRSHECQLILGLDENNLDVFQDVNRYVHPEDRNEVNRVWTAAIKKNHPFSYEYRIIKPHGEIRWIEVKAETVFDEDGQPSVFLGVVSDITERRKSLMELQRSEQQLKLALQGGRLGTWTVQFPEGKILSDGRTKELHGLLSEENLEEFLKRQLHPNDSELVIEAVKKVREGSNLFQVEYRVRKTDGSYRWVYSRGEPKRSSSGELVTVSGIVFDITDQIEARKAIEESELRAQEIANNLPIIVWTARPDGYVDWYNDWWYEYLNQPRGTQWDDKDKQPMHPDDIPKTLEVWSECIKTGCFYTIEQRFRRGSDGQYRWHLVRGIPIRDENGVITKWVGGNTDIHDAKMLAEELVQARAAAESANQLKSNFLANMSHEIRTPLAAILGFSNLLKDRNLAAEEKDNYIDTIVRNGNSLTRIIDDILDLAKVEAGRLDVENIPFSLLELTTDVVDVFRDKTKAKNIYMLLKVEDSVPSQICSDPTRLRQILVNLIGNAVKFTSQGGVRVYVRATKPVDSKVQITIDVEDTGIGLTPEQKEKLFQPFMQADNSMTRKFGGTGLGLALSQRLSEALSGKITIIEGKSQEGSTFSLSFTAKLAKDKTEKTDSPANEVSMDTTQLEGFHILVVDDSPDNQFLVARPLTKNGAQIDTAHDGHEGFNKALAGSYDLILMDIQMPTMDGYQAKRALDEKGFKTPVIALTAHAMSDERMKTKAAGFAGHLTKPLHAKELLKAVASVIKTAH